MRMEIENQVIEAADYKKSPLNFELPNSDYRWMSQIKPALVLLQKGGAQTLRQLHFYISRFVYISGCGNLASLSTLETLYRGKDAHMAAFFTHLLPAIASLALSIETHFPAGRLAVIPKDQKMLLRVHRRAVASIVACSFFCLLKEKQKGVEMIDYNMILLHEVFSENVMQSKILSYLQYFISVTNRSPEGHILVGRNTAKENVHSTYANSKARMKEVVVKDAGGIEDSVEAVQIDFANEYIGGGCMEAGCVQEELMFLKCPELLVSRVLNTVMGPKDAIYIKGVEQYTRLEGYGWDFEFAGPEKDPLMNVKCGTVIDRDIVAIDAICFSGSSANQYSHDSILRELTKAHSGFSASLEFNINCKKPISTGRWGCGAFRGDSQLKFVIQWLAASQVGKSMVFYRKGDHELEAAEKVVGKLGGLGVGELYEWLVKRLKERHEGVSVFEALLM